MKIQPLEIDLFLKKIPANIKGILIYGHDYGSVNIRLTNLIKNMNIKNDNIVNIEYSSLKNSSELLMSNLMNRSIFGNKNLIIVRNVTSILKTEIISLLDLNNSTNFIVFLSEELSPSSTLRVFFEKSNKYACIACYKDDKSSVRKIIRDYLIKINIKLTSESLLYMENNLIGDRLFILSELEKLSLYSYGKECLSDEDIKKIISSMEDVSIEILCYHFASNNFLEFYSILLELSKQNFSYIGIIRILQNYFLKLQYIKSKCLSGLNIEQALSYLKPPLFFKTKNNFIKNISNLSNTAIISVISDLIDLEKKIKITPINNKLLCEHFLFKIMMNLSSEMFHVKHF